MVQLVVVLMTLGVLGLAPASTADAACLKDMRGEVICGTGPCGRDQRGDVYCAPVRFGSAFRTRDGWIYCAHGQCLADRNGYVCSDVEGGSVVRLIDGTTRCEGNCTYASWEMCERIPAGR
jgi:hypothetical protein